MTDDQVPTIVDTVFRTAGKLAANLPIIGGALEVIMEDTSARRVAKARKMIDGIAGPGNEIALIDRLRLDEPFEAFFIRAMNAGLQTGMDAKRRLLVRAVRQVFEDSAQLDDAQLLCDSIAELEVPHVRALAQLDAEWQNAQRDIDPVTLTWGNSIVWDQLPAPIRAALVRTGTGRSADRFVARPGANRQSGITDYGLQILNELRMEGYE